jgi:hypothetical protein
MNETAKVIRFYKTGGPEVLKVEDVRWPQPVGNEVLIRVRALALSRLDLLWREGSYCEEPQFPAQIGYEAPPASSSWSALLKRFWERLATWMSTTTECCPLENDLFPKGKM